MPRNLLVVDSNTNKLKPFDFDFAAKVGSKEERPERNDIDGIILRQADVATTTGTRDHYRLAIEALLWKLRTDGWKAGAHVDT
jgi:hypothetical protein